MTRALILAPLALVNYWTAFSLGFRAGGHGLVVIALAIIAARSPYLNHEGLLLTSHLAVG